MKPGVRFHIRDTGAQHDLAIGPGKIALLEAIHDTGSITAAARRLGMSYRRAWLLVDETNRCLVGPAVATASGGEKGGGTALTPLGAKLVLRYRALERETANAVRRKLRSMLRTA
ncbi:MAG TPA: ModE family transcriptional regulator [Casimicrobiaceae bacterium]|nr:ModE family transcriptional regulator [Casimicrobiaceae bacterium]